MSDRYFMGLSYAFFLTAVMLGGASRADEIAQVPLRLAAIGFLVAAFWKPNFVRIGRYKSLFAFMLSLIVLMLLHLVPLPPLVWSNIPGRDYYSNIAQIIGTQESWRPYSLAPSLTRNSIYSLIVPLTALIIFSQVPVEKLRNFAFVILIIGFFSLILGFAQVSQGAASSLRIYRVTNEDSMVGVFANRNHHAVLLALCFPVIAFLGVSYRRDKTFGLIGTPACIIGVFTIGGALLLTGSRAGLVIGAIGFFAGAVLYASSVQSSRKGQANAIENRSKLISLWRSPWMIPLAAASAIFIAAIAFVNTPGIQRLLRANLTEEDRLQYFPTMLEVAFAHLPLGGGFGSFDRLFRRFEESDQLRTAYLNHAHMEPMELLIDGGFPAITLVLIFLFFWGRLSLRAWRASNSERNGVNLARLGTILTFLLLLASLVDYPLRTPIHMIIFVVGCIWMQRIGSPQSNFSSPSKA